MSIARACASLALLAPVEVFPSGETEDGAPAVGLIAFVEPSMSCKKSDKMGHGKAEPITP